jgi:hypothetical protein
MNELSIKSRRTTINLRELEELPTIWHEMEFEELVI